MRGLILRTSMAALILALPLCSANSQEKRRPAPILDTESVMANRNAPPPPLEGAVTELSMTSDPGDYIGAGKSYLFKKQDGSFTCRAHDRSGDKLVDNIQIDFSGKGNHFSFIFSTAKMGKNLEMGTYDARRDISAESGEAGMDIDGNHRGCNRLTGTFTILDAQFDYSTSPVRVVSFAVEFEQHCEEGKSALKGTLYYNSLPFGGFRK